VGGRTISSWSMTSSAMPSMSSPWPVMTGTLASRAMRCMSSSLCIDAGGCILSTCNSQIGGMSSLQVEGATCQHAAETVFNEKAPDFQDNLWTFA
jgi:hypothetical protein